MNEKENLSDFSKIVVEKWQTGRAISEVEAG